jgi:hypothetical protein
MSHPNAEQAVSPEQVMDVISRMPPEMLDQIAQFLPARDLAVLRRASQTMQAATEHEWQAEHARNDQWLAYLRSVQDQMDYLAGNQDINDLPTIETLISAAEIYASYDGTDWTRYTQLIQRQNNEIRIGMPAYVNGIDNTLERVVENNGLAGDAKAIELDGRIRVLLAAFPH